MNVLSTNLEILKNMKKLCLIICSITLLALQISAQESKRKFRFGLRVAPQMTWIKADYKNIPKNETCDKADYKLSW